MTPLPLDYTRCLGNGSAGRICVMRQQCQRYIDSETQQDADAFNISYGMMLCATSRYECWIPVEVKNEN
jgi:hypothetical protein